MLKELLTIWNFTEKVYPMCYFPETEDETMSESLGHNAILIK